jgi:nucleotide-binding universal stress UspA family protein
MKVLIAYDGSSHADTAISDLQWAGLPQNTQAMVLSVVEWPLQAPRSWGMVDTGFAQEWTMHVQAAEASAEAACQRIQRQYPRRDVKMETPTGNPSAMILERASGWPADLIVVGTHGRSRAQARHKDHAAPLVEHARQAAAQARAAFMASLQHESFGHLAQ